MAETSSPGSAADWTFQDRDTFTARWNRACAINLMSGARGAQQYASIGQRTAFYNWFDQIREIQGHTILWPAAAWIVASQMRSLEDPIRTAGLTVRRAASGRFEDSTRLIAFGRDGNKAIFDDVFPRLKEVFERGLRGNRLTGAEADGWDRQTLRHEQFDVVQPIYQRHAGADAAMAGELAAMASGDDILGIGGVAIGWRLDFTGNIMLPQDRFNHGMNVVVPFYRRFKQVIDQARTRRQASRPDPSAGGMVQVR